MPVEADQLQVEELFVGEPTQSLRESEQGEEHDHPDGDVGAVEPGQHVEGRGRRVGAKGHALEGDELGELEDLTCQEHRTEHGGRQQPGAGGALVAAATALWASTMVRELISSTKELTDVKGMS